MNKIKINKIDKALWYYPSIFTASKNRWSSRPFLSLKELFEKNDLNNFNAIISINPDGALLAFDYAQNRWNYQFKLTKIILDSLASKQKKTLFLLKN